MQILSLILVVNCICFIQINQLIKCEKNAYIQLPDKFTQEEVSIGSLIVNLADELIAYEKLKYDSNKKHQHHQRQLDTTNKIKSQHFTFLEESKTSAENMYFLLDSITGRITSKRYIDRESMCMNRHCANSCGPGGPLSSLNSNKTDTTGNCILKLKLLCIPSYKIVKQTIVIMDINDNPPTFTVNSMKQNVAENVPVGFKLPLTLAYDPDIGQNSVQNYRLTSTNKESETLVDSTFDLIHIKPNETNAEQLVLVTKRNLNSEKVNS
jgi:hypothetical protein